MLLIRHQWKRVVLKVLFQEIVTQLAIASGCLDGDYSNRSRYFSMDLKKLYKFIFHLDNIWPKIDLPVFLLIFTWEIYQGWVELMYWRQLCKELRNARSCIGTGTLIRPTIIAFQCAIDSTFCMPSSELDCIFMKRIKTN